MTNTENEFYIDHFKELVSRLKSSDWKVRNLARKELRELDNSKSYKTLIEALDSPDPYVQLVAANHLFTQEQTRSIEVLLSLLVNGKASLQLETINALGRFRVNRAVEPILQILIDKNLQIWLRNAAGKALGEINDTRAITPLTNVFLDESDVELDINDVGAREVAAISLTKFGSKTSQVFLASIAKGNNGTRWLAALALGKLGNREATPYLIPLLSDEDVTVRRYTAVALGQIRDKRAAEALSRLLQIEKNNYVREKVVLALGEIADMRSLEPLMHILETPSSASSSRAKAAEILGELGDIKAATLLIQALKDKEADVRVKSAQALAHLGFKKALPDLEWIIQNPNGVRHYNQIAQDALLKAFEDLKNL